jgi:hypothetical protein
VDAGAVKDGRVPGQTDNTGLLTLSKKTAAEKNAAKMPKPPQLFPNRPQDAGQGNAGPQSGNAGLLSGQRCIGIESAAMVSWQSPIDLSRLNRPLKALRWPLGGDIASAIV